MTLRNLPLKSTYDTSDLLSNPVSDFLEPCLGESVRYDRLSGYFSSKVLSLAAQGLADFLMGNGKMRLVMSSQMNSTDYAFLESAFSNKSNYDHLFEGFDFSSDSMVTILSKKHLEAMCWLMAKGRLEIRIVVFQGERDGQHEPIFHPKVGIFRDHLDDRISFSGSINETVSGWTRNLEEFKVFRSWDLATQSFVLQDEDTFQKFWDNASNGEFHTIPLPEAIRQKLISQAPDDMPDIRAEHHHRSIPKPRLDLRNYQQAAVDAWISSNYCGILEMATGTGKTKTARVCIESILKRDHTLAVITAPYEHIAKQWIAELKDLNPILASGSNNWKDGVKDSLNRKKLRRQEHLVIVAVQNTAAAEAFTAVISECLPLFVNSLFVGDEVHGLGATSFQLAMNPEFKYRLGLSATPDRYFDEVGTSALVKYFNGTIYTFSTSEAMKWRDPVTGHRALSPYKYYPQFVSLSEVELIEYEVLSDKISKMQSFAIDFDRERQLELLLFKRAAIIKTAEEKLPSLRNLLTPMAIELQYALIYCHSLEQLTEVANILLEIGVSFQKITGQESNSPSKNFQGLSERDWILKNFTDGTTKVLLAIKCLDEGVDIPAAKMGFILASSGNPREFIQRRGRLLRPSPGKEFAIIYDFVVVPRSKKTTPRIGDHELSTFTKELQRIDEFAEEALNTDEIRVAIGEIVLEMGING